MKDFRTENGFFTGNVGIGTTNPSAELEVNGQIISNRRFMSENSLELVSDYNGNGATSIISFKIDGQDASDEKMRIHSTGNVGIGTTNPIGSLHMHSATSGVGPILQLSNDTGDCRLFFGTDSETGSANAAGQIRYNVASNNMSFYSNLNERMRIDSSGNLGIGTTNPSQGKLVTTGYGGHSNTRSFVAIAHNNNVESYFRIARMGSGDSTSISLANNYNRDVPAYQTDDNTAGISDITFRDDGSLSFSTGAVGTTEPVEKMRIEASGNVGIGTTNPQTALDITRPNAASYSPAIMLGKDPRNSHGNLILQGQIVGTHYDEQGKATAPVGASRINFGNGDLHIERSGSTSSGNVRSWRRHMSIIDNGNVGIGTTNPTASRLDVWQTESTSDSCIKTVRPGTAERTHLAFYNANGIVGTIEAGGTTTSYNTSSDYRLKENVVEVDNAIERVNKLKPCRFNFITDPEKIVDGFLAHEVQEVVPEAISGEKDAVREEEYEIAPAELDNDGNVITEAEMGTRQVPDYQGIDQSKLVPLLTKAIQEQQTIIEDLKARIETLENK